MILDMNMFITLLIIYIAIGFTLLFFNPVKKVLRDEFFKFSFEASISEISKQKILLFKILVISAFILIWPILLPSVFAKYPTTYENKDDMSVEKPRGLRFMFMGGRGTIKCNDCNFSQELTSFTHGYHQGEKGLHQCGTSGFQCQSCGKLTTRKRIEPFVKAKYTNTLYNTPEEQRANVILHMLSSVDRCKSYMKKTPKNRWLAVWEPTVTEFTKELATVSVEEIESIQAKEKAYEKSYQDTLVCNCGGRLDKEQILFCPNCKSKNLDYEMKYIT